MNASANLFDIPNERRVQYFRGREIILSKLTDNLRSQVNGGEPSLIGLVGMGGVGKTQIALEFCRRAYKEKLSRHIFWINAVSAESVKSSLLRMGNIMSGGRGRITDQKAILSALADLEKPFLLVYDNYDDPVFDNILELIPYVGAGMVIITSRLESIGSIVGMTLNVGMMTTQEAAELLQTRSKVNVFVNGQIVRPVQELLELLGGLPLAIDQAGAYIAHKSVPYEVYLNLFRTRRQEINAEVPERWQYARVEDSIQEKVFLTVSTTWELSLQLLGKNDEDRSRKIAFLTQAAFLGCTTVSRVFFSSVTALTRWNGAVHARVLCDGPQCVGLDTTIRATRYQCVVCHDVDFCATCEALLAADGSHPHSLKEYEEDAKVENTWSFRRIKRPGKSSNYPDDNETQGESHEELPPGTRSDRSSLAMFEEFWEYCADEDRNIIYEACSSMSDWLNLFCFPSTGIFDDLRWQNIMSELSNLSLIQGCISTAFGKSSFSFHRVVQDWIRTRCVNDRILYQISAYVILTIALYRFRKDGHAMTGVDLARMATEDIPSNNEAVIAATSSLSEEFGDHISFFVAQSDPTNTSQSGFQRLGSRMWPNLGFANHMLLHGNTEIPLNLYRRFLLGWTAADYETRSLGDIFHATSMRLEYRQRSSESLLDDMKQLVQQSREQSGDYTDQALMLMMLWRVAQEHGDEELCEKLSMEFFEVLMRSTDDFREPLDTNILLPALQYVDKVEAQDEDMSKLWKCIVLTVETSHPEEVGHHSRMLYQKLQVFDLIKEDRSLEAFELAQAQMARAVQEKGEAHPEVLFTRVALASCYLYSGQTRKALEEGEPYLFHQIATLGFENPELFSDVSFHFETKLQLGGEATEEAKNFLLDKFREGKSVFARCPRKSMSIQLCVVEIFAQSLWLVDDQEDWKYEEEVFSMAAALMDTAQESLESDDVLRMRIEEIWLRVALEVQELIQTEDIKIANILHNKQAIVDVLLSTVLRKQNIWQIWSLCELLLHADRLAEAVTLFTRADTDTDRRLDPMWEPMWELVGPVCTAILRKCSGFRSPEEEEVCGKLAKIASTEHDGQNGPNSGECPDTVTWSMIRFRTFIHLGVLSDTRMGWALALREYEKALGLLDWRATREAYLGELEQVTIEAVVKFAHAYAKNIEHEDIATINKAQGTDSISDEWLSSSPNDVAAARTLFAPVRLQLYSRKYIIIQLPKNSICRIPLQNQNLTASIVYELFSLIRSEASKYSIGSSIFFPHFSTAGAAIIRFSGFFEPSPMPDKLLGRDTEAYARSTWKRLPQAMLKDEKGKSLKIVETSSKRGMSVAAESEGSIEGEIGQPRESTATRGRLEEFGGFGPEMEVMYVVGRTLWGLGDEKGSNIAYVLSQ